MRGMIGSKMKSAFFLFLFLCLVLGIFASYALWTYYQQVSSDMNTQAARMTKLISRLCANVLPAQDFAQLDKILENVLQYDDVLSIRFEDRQGATVRERIKARDQQEAIEVKEALPPPADVAGSIIVRFSTDRTRALKAKYLRQKAIEVVLGAGVASLLLLLILNRHFSRPLHALAQRMNSVADSEGVPLSPVPGEDGFVSVEKALTSLSDHLRGMRTRADALSSGFSQTKSHMVSIAREVTLKGDSHRAAVAETSLTAHALHNAIPGTTASTEKLAELAEKAAVFIVEMNASMATISDKSEVFHESAQETASSIEEMIASIKQIAENLNILNSSAENTSSSITEITASVKQIEEGAAESVALADKVNIEAAQKGMTALHAAMQGMADIKSHMDDLSQVINALGKRSKEIEGILTVISDVTDETNLLSLNAAILAAQAGESGRAFSVVAAEIRGLANRTALSTKEISALIKSVQDQTRSSVTTAAGVMEAVEKGSFLFKDVKDVLNHIIESSSASTNMAQSIQKAATEEVLAIRHIADAMVKITEQITHISSATAEQSKGSKFILEAAEKVKTASLEVKQAVEAEYGETKGMTTVIQDVGFMALQIADDIKGQKQQSADVVLRLEKLAQEAKEFLRLTRELDAAADASNT